MAAHLARANVVVVGGGAAGLMAAIAAARTGASVAILESDRRVGQKILATGNGRCNLSNTHVEPESFNHPEFVAPLLHEYDCAAVVSMFAQMGLSTYVDDEGRVYPVTNAANSVLNVLRLEAEHLGVSERCESKVVALGFREAAPRVMVALSDGKRIEADAVVVATGGGSELLANIGHAVEPFVPVLCPIATDTAPIRGLSGLRVRCAASVVVPVGASEELRATERGELLFRDYGVSGVMVFDLSRHIEPGCVLSIDFVPERSKDELRADLVARVESLGWRTAETFLEGLLHPRLAQVITRELGVARDVAAGEIPLETLVGLLKDFRLSVEGPGDPKQAQVTRGGATVEGFDPVTLRSLQYPLLFGAGEALDIDGRCGGFNLHWAWASGYRAGESAVGAALEAHGS